MENFIAKYKCPWDYEVMSWRWTLQQQPSIFQVPNDLFPNGIGGFHKYWENHPQAQNTPTNQSDTYQPKMNMSSFSGQLPVTMENLTQMDQSQFS